MHRFDTILTCCETQVPHCTYHLKGNTGLKWLLLLGTYQVNLGSCHRGTRVETNILQRLHSSQNLFRFPVFSTTHPPPQCYVKQLGQCNHHLQGRKKESGERKQFKSTSRHEKNSPFGHGWQSHNEAAIAVLFKYSLPLQLLGVFQFRLTQADEPWFGCTHPVGQFLHNVLAL